MAVLTTEDARFLEHVAQSNPTGAKGSAEAPTGVRQYKKLVSLRREMQKWKGTI